MKAVGLLFFLVFWIGGMFLADRVWNLTTPWAMCWGFVLASALDDLRRRFFG